MRELEGRSYAEIGAILDLSLSAVETLLFRARRALREQLEGALTCGEAEAALSKRLDGRLAAAEQRALRAHLRECSECAVLERRQRARRTAVKGLGGVPLPPSLAGFLGEASSVTGGAIAGSSLVAKAAAVVAAGVVAGGVGHEAVQAVAAGTTRTPLPELRQLPRGYATPLGALQAPGIPALGVPAGGNAIGVPGTSTTRRVGEGIQAELERPSTETGGGSDQVIAPPPGVVSPTAVAVDPTAPAVDPPAAPSLLQPVVETAEAVVEQVPALLDPPEVGQILPPPPPLPLPLSPPPLPPLPLPPPPPLPLLLPPPPPPPPPLP